MADEGERASAIDGDTGAAAAMAIGIGAAAANERVAAKMEAFLEEQTILIRLKAKEIAHEAQQQLAKASSLDLSASDKALLPSWVKGHG